MSGTPLSAACLSPLLCSAFPVPGTNAMRCYDYEEQEGSVVWARLSAVAPWFCWRRSADSLGSSCCVGQKQGPIPQQYFCLLPSYLQQRQQAWFSASVLPFLPLSCGRSSLSLAPCPPSNNFQLLELLRAWRWLCPNSLWQKVGGSWCWGFAATCCPQAVHSKGMALSIFWVLREKSDASAKLGCRARSCIPHMQMGLLVTARSVRLQCSAQLSPQGFH